MTILPSSQRKSRFVALCGVALCALSTHNAQAQSLPDAATSTADPGRVEQPFETQAVPGISPRVEVKDMILQKAPEGADEIFLELKTVKLTGVTVYNEERLTSVYADKIGQKISLAEVYGIADKLTRKYRNDGYILTQVVVPPQTIDGGDVELRVVEGFIESINVEGPEESEKSLALVRSYAADIKTDGALNIKNLERYLLLIGDLPGLDARSVLSPSQTTAGAANLRIIVSRDIFEASIGLDNYGSRYLGPWEASASGAANSLFGLNERITMQAIGAPGSGSDNEDFLELGYVAAGYQQPVAFLGKGAVFDIYASHTDTEPGFNLAQFDVEGKSDYISAKLSYPFYRSRTTNLRGYAMFDWRNVTSYSNVQDTLRDKIRAIRAGGSYEFLDTTFKTAAVNAISIEFSKGISSFNASDKNDDNLTRTHGDPGFKKVTAEVQRLQRVAPKLNLLTAAYGQWSAHPLLSSEEFGVGGQKYGRGYDSSEIVGDDGYAAKIELQWSNPRATPIFSDYKLFGFFDIGKVWNKDATTSDNKTETLTSTGAGIRTKFTNGMKGDLTVALPINNEVQTQGDQSPRVFLSLRQSF